MRKIHDDDGINKAKILIAVAVAVAAILAVALLAIHIVNHPDRDELRGEALMQSLDTAVWAVAAMFVVAILGVAVLALSSTTK